MKHLKKYWKRYLLFFALIFVGGFIYFGFKGFNFIDPKITKKVLDNNKLPE